MSEQTQDRSSDTGEYPTPQPGRSARLLLPMRLAVRFLWGGDLTDRVRALLLVVAIALSATVVLLTLATFAALDQRDARADALTPAYVSSPWAPIYSSEQMPSAAELLEPPGRFWVDVQEQPYRGQPVTVLTIARPAGASGEIPPPPGATLVPGPGEAVVSPALEELLATPAGADLRARLPQTVVGTLSSGGLLDDGDLRAYVGVEMPASDPSWEQGYVATGWGDSSLAPELRSGATLRILLLAGIVVVITPLLVLIALLGRLGGPARERRLATLALLGAPATTTRTVAAGEAAVLGVAGAALATAAFPLITAVVSGVRVDGVPLSSRSLSLSVSTLLGTAMVIGAATAVIGAGGAGRSAASALATARRSGERPPRWWKGLALLAVGLLLLCLGLTNGGLYSQSSMLLTLCAGLALTLVSVAMLAGPAVGTAGRVLRGRGPLTTLAAARIAADPRARAGTVAGVGVVLAGAIALQAVLALVSADRTATSESTAPAYRVFLTPAQPSLTVGDSAQVVDVLAAAPGAEEITGGFFLRGDFGAGMVINPDRTIDMSQTVEVMVASCRAIPEVPDCRDGEVYRLDTQLRDAATEADPPAGTAIRFPGAAAAWTLPEVAGTLEPDRMLRGGNLYNYLVTPGALGPLASLPASSAAIDLRVFGPASTEAADHLRAELTRQGWQVNLDTTAEATGDRGNLLAVGRAGLAGTAALTVLAALGGLLVLTFAQVNRNRRAVALALAAGWPRAALRRSFVLESAVSALAVVPIATAVAYGLAAVLTRLGRPATDLPSVGMTALLALGAAAVTVLAAWLAATLAVRTVDVTDLRTG